MLKRFKLEILFQKNNQKDCRKLPENKKTNPSTKLDLRERELRIEKEKVGKERKKEFKLEAKREKQGERKSRKER